MALIDLIELPSLIYPPIFFWEHAFGVEIAPTLLEEKNYVTYVKIYIFFLTLLAFTNLTQKCVFNMNGN